MIWISVSRSSTALTLACALLAILAFSGPAEGLAAEQTELPAKPRGFAATPT
jgi:hypothetical protein